MADDLIPKIPAKAFVKIGGSTFDIHDVTLSFSATSLPTANMSLAVGYTFDGKRVFDSSKLEVFNEGAEGEVYVDFSGASDFPGMPKGETLVFKGYVSAVGPSVSLDSGSTFGVQLQHRGIADLSSGSTVQWGSMLIRGSADPKQTAQVMTGDVVTGATLTQEGLLSVLVSIYKKFMEASGGLAGGPFQQCTGARELNDLAIAALGALTGSPLKLRAELANDYSMFNFLKQRVVSDLWTMSVAEQIQTLGQDLFFRAIPHADGSVEVAPLATFGAEFAAIDAKHIFAFSPSFAANRRVAGVVLIARTPDGGNTAAGNVGGCYVFPQSVVRAGVVQPIDLPSWMTVSIADTQRRVDASSPVTSPSTVGNQSTTGADIAPEAKTRAEGAAKTYGDAFAREIARKLRYQECTAQITTHFRTDIGVLSTVKVKAPVTLDQDATIYGRVDSLTLSISSQDGTALATYGLAYVRSEATQRNILADGGDQHPIYTDKWTGSKL